MSGEKLEQMAEEYASRDFDKMLGSHISPPWKAQYDAFKAGHASRDAEVEKFRAVADAARGMMGVVWEGIGTGVERMKAWYALRDSLAALNRTCAALDQDKGEGK